MPLKIALTGPMGSGKSTALEYFQSLGYHILSADLLVKQLYKTDEKLIQQIKYYFGKKIIKNSIINTELLANIVFKDIKALTWLENKLHPKIKNMWENVIKQNPLQNWIVEIPLLFEKKLEKFFNFSICVACSETTQQKRLENKGYSPDAIQLRLQHQWRINEKIKKADVVFWNESNIEMLKKQILYWTQHFPLPDSLQH